MSPESCSEAAGSRVYSTHNCFPRFWCTALRPAFWTWAPSSSTVLMWRNRTRGGNGSQPPGSTYLVANAFPAELECGPWPLWIPSVCVWLLDLCNHWPSGHAYDSLMGHLMLPCWAECIWPGASLSCAHTRQPLFCEFILCIWNYSQNCFSQESETKLFKWLNQLSA